MMGSKFTICRFVGLVFLVAALTGGTANAMNAGGSTPQGLKADGLRLQGLAVRYAQIGRRPFESMARLNEIPAASFYTPQALKAQGLRWQRMAQAYSQPQVVRNSSTFDWGAAGIGAIGVFVVMLCGAVLFLGVRRIREEKLAV